MKKLYITPKIKVIEINDEDIIATSPQMATYSLSPEDDEGNGSGE